MTGSFLNLDTDTTLGGNNASDYTVSSQKAIKSYVDAHSGGSYTAGDGIDITNGVISVDGEQSSEVTLATVATSGSYNDLSNKPDLSGYAVDSAVVHTTGSETITGAKTFQVGYNGVILKNPANSTYSDLTFNDNSGNLIGKIRGSISSSGTKTLTIGNDSEKVSICANVNVWQPASADAYTQIDSVLRPGTDNTYNLGTSSFRWKQLFAGTTTISTSDERLKQQISEIPDEVLDAWGNVGFCQFKFNDSVEEKGDNARYHTGMIAQRIKEVFENADIDPFSYGLLCYDEWEATEAEYDENGGVVVPAQEAGDRYSLRYEECLCMEAAYQRRRADRIEARLAALEARLND